jgi:glutathione peroxidase
MIKPLLSLAVAFSLCGPCLAEGEAKNDQPVEKQNQEQTVPPALNHTMKSLEGKDVNLAQYKGKVVMMVNTASKCGLTPQYKQLEAIYEKYKDRGFVILGFPANNFGAQEPGSDEEIGAFCEKNYGVKFPMFSKISVKGDDKAPLYQYLTGDKLPVDPKGDISWNFEKFLLNRNGEVVARFSPKVTPDAAEVTQKIEAELANK